MPSDEQYLFDNRAAQAGDRFGALSELFDPITFEHLRNLGVGSGARCWEVGAGGGSVARWMADQVGPSGRVVATDLDVRWLEQDLRSSRIEVRRHDLVEDDPPDGEFDVVHERLVLVHVREREQGVERMVSALRPGGWLLAEDFDATAGDGGYIDAASDVAELGAMIAAGIRRLLVDRGAEPSLGARLPALLERAGLVRGGSVVTQPTGRPQAVCELHRANIDQVADQLVDRGLVSRADLDRYVARLADGSLRPSAPTLVSAWAQRPAS